MINQTTTERVNHNTINPTTNQDNVLNTTITAKKIFSNANRSNNNKYNLLRFPSQMNNNNTTLTFHQTIQREFRTAQENTNMNLALFTLK